MKRFFLVALVLSAAWGARALGTGDLYRVGNVQLNCKGANGLTITTKEVDAKSPEKTTIVTQFGEYTEEYSAYVNPYFFQWTWVSLGLSEQTVGQGYQIYLLGNAPEGVETTLLGSLGRVYTIPTGGGWRYPVGYVPQTAMTCKIFWTNLLK